ncbi:MAG: hypothetical protein Q9216_005552 [Gyalolechia sp. 2 TL-2023]
MTTYKRSDLIKGIHEGIQPKNDELGVWAAFMENSNFIASATATTRDKEQLLTVFYNGWKDCRTKCWILDHLRLHLEQHATLPPNALVDESMSSAWSQGVLGVAFKVRHITENCVSEMKRQNELAKRKIFGGPL